MQHRPHLPPIETERHYEAVLAEVAELMDAPPDTPDGDRLDALASLIESCEARHWPIDPSG
jgi:HTH-type transcriptional regulator / antitoxin HigA